MLISMTGFGSSNFEDAKLSINVELKSFNSRYFELNTKSFDLSGPFEYKIRDFLKKKLSRGSVTLMIRVDSKDYFKFNQHKTESVLKAYKAIEAKYSLDLNYSQLLRNNDILSYVPLSTSGQRKIFKAVKEAANELIEMRKKEGMQIEKEFHKYLEVARKDLIKIENIQHKVHMSKVNAKSNIDNIDEIEKIDISEEIDRVNSHLKPILQTIKSPNLSGKKLTLFFRKLIESRIQFYQNFLIKEYQSMLLV